MELHRFPIAREDGITVFGTVGADNEGVYATEQAWGRPGQTVYGFLWEIGAWT